MKKINPAYGYAFLIMFSLLLNVVLKIESENMVLIIGLGFFYVIYILNKISKKL